MSQHEREQLRLMNAGISKIDRLYSRWSQKSGVNTYAVGILYMLIEDGCITQKQISDEFDIPKQSVNNVISGLKNDGYISMEISRRDKRERVIVLTEGGKEYALKILTPLFEMEEAVVERLGEERMNQLIETTTAYADILEQVMFFG